ncbi:MULTISPECIES: magnesium chelatase subunit D [Ramlibacter]|uniref:Magnesium chelatase subunit D n=1 Tax=Ramlibacter aquaticus TaxID=2780094 RepID=A0ABR9SHD5_9BURK|nr:MULTISPECIES: magnesium chelatase subunit D [Ramlibacter]MBE7941771.1 magnesium chelatase subunit D [Ramlibacter aquaticus]
MKPGPALAAAVLAVDPAGLGGAVLRGPAGAAREAWLDRLRACLPAATPWLRLPVRLGDAALLGGLDLGATLAAGRPVASTGLAARAHGGVLLAPMAERMEPALAGRLAHLLDSGELVLEREGLAARLPARFALLALDEGTDDERLPAALADRLALHLHADAPGADADDAQASPASPGEVAAARERLAALPVDEALLEGLCGAAHALGVASLRAPLLAWRCARALAALRGADAVHASDAAVAAAWVLAPRATRLPEPAPQPEADDPPPQAPENAAQDTERDADASSTEPPPGDQLLEAARAALPAGLLASLAIAAARERAGAAGRSGAAQRGHGRGRPVGARPGDPRTGPRLHLVETLRAAAPWQGLRLRERAARGQPPAGRIEVRREDFRVRRHVQRRRTTTIFVVDASGSAALHRLAEAKGAVELMLADCYVRRDEVAVIAFRGHAAELLLPPTRSLARARRSLAGLPGGGGTPLAAGLDAAAQLADAVRRRGDTPLVVLLTDGRANIARDGSPGRERAGADALAAARELGSLGHAALVLDTSPHPHPAAETLAAAMRARYLPLPHGAAEAMHQAVRQAG